MFEERFRQYFTTKEFYLLTEAGPIPLFVATNALYLPSWVFKKIFPIELIKNGIGLGDISKQIVPIFMKHDPKNASMP